MSGKRRSLSAVAASSSYQGGPDLAGFLAVRGCGLSGELVAALSPRLMHWADDCWLVDLRPTSYYWATQSRLRQVQALALVQRVLEQQLAATHQEAPAALSLALAPDPWQALVLSSHLAERQLSGTVALTDAFGQALWRQLSWPAWLQSARAYGQAAERAGLKGFHLAFFHQQLAHLERTIRRLQIHQPAQLEAASAAAMRRRYGEQVARLWQWTYAAARPAAATVKTLGLDDELVLDGAFPWCPWRLAEPPGVRRSLEQPLWLWAHLEAELALDLDQLARVLAKTSAPAVVRLSWLLQMDDMRTCLVLIRFRHPHDLGAELGQQQTALAQAAYSFQAVYGKLASGETNEVAAPLIGWTLCVEECLATQAVTCDLFGQLSGGGEQALQRLDNQLPLALERYQVEASWVPEEAFSRQEERCSGPPTSLAKPWPALAARRPLYIYTTPQPSAAPWKSAFLERTGEVWWRQPDGVTLERNYFLLEDKAGQWRWGTQQSGGEWAVHGVFA